MTEHRDKFPGRSRRSPICRSGAGVATIETW